MHLWKHLQTRLPTPEEVRSEWRTFPYGNVGCVLGQISGLVRIDSDGAEGESILAEWSQGDLPPTWTFYSSPGSRGLLYAWPTDIPCRSTAKGLPGDHKELRLMGNGSQTVLPPSRHSSGSLYTWEPGRSPNDIGLAPAPDWLIARLQQEKRQPAGQGDYHTGMAPNEDRVASALAAIPNDDAGYDLWLTLGMALHSTGAAWAEAAWEVWSQQSPKYNPDKQAKTWNSFQREGAVTLGSLYHHAHQHGWTFPRTTSALNGAQSFTGDRKASTPYGDLFYAEWLIQLHGENLRYCPP